MSEPALSRGGAIGARLSVMMFLEFFVWGAWYVSMGPFLNSRNMDGAFIGWAYSLGPIAAIVSPFFLGMVADRFFPSERVLGAMHLLGGLILCAAPAAMNIEPNLFLVAVVLHMLCYMPTLGLTNTLAFHNMTNQEKQFPLIRVWGTIGWIAANVLIAEFELGTDPAMFYLAGGAGVLLGLYSFSLPHTPPPAKGSKFSTREALGLDAVALMREPSFAVFMLCSFLICIPLAAYYAAAGEYVRQIGYENFTFQMSFGQMSEILFMIVMPLFFARLGVKWMLLVGMGAWVLRYGLFSAAADDQVKWMVLSGIILHGICYDFFFVTGQIYVDKKANPRIRGAAQGFLVLVTQGLGLFIGAKVVGEIWERSKADNYDALFEQAQAMRAEAAELMKGGTEAGAERAQQLIADSAPIYMQATDWGQVWLIPCIFAGAIMAIFFLFFHDKSIAGVTPTDAEVAAAAEDVEGMP